MACVRVVVNFSACMKNEAKFFLVGKSSMALWPPQFMKKRNNLANVQGTKKREQHILFCNNNKPIFIPDST